MYIYGIILSDCNTGMDSSKSVIKPIDNTINNTRLFGDMHIVCMHIYKQDLRIALQLPQNYLPILVHVVLGNNFPQTGMYKN